MKRIGLAFFVFVVSGLAHTMPAFSQTHDLSLWDRVLNALGLYDPPPVVAPPSPPPPAVDLFPRLPRLRLVPLDAQVSEGGTIEVTVEREGGEGEIGVSVTVSTVSESATADDDFGTIDRIVTFDPREKTRTLTLQTVGDDVHEGDEAFTVQLSAPRQATIADGAGSTRITIVDNDDPPATTLPAKMVTLPERVDFGKGLVGTGAVVIRELTLVNNGEESGRVDDILINDRGEKVFSFLVDDCSGRVIGADSGCSLTIAFRPKAAGSYPAKLTFVTSVGQVEAQLTAAGVLPELKEDIIGAAIAAERAARLAGTADILTLVAPPDPPPLPPRYDNTDPDYEELGIGKNWFTFPVDRTRIIVAVDRIIPCVLEDTINSQVPGFVNCVVESNVYGPDGRIVLIDKGTAVIGDYEGLDDGNTRLNIIWRRFMRPDGSSISIGDGFQTADSSGRTGVPGNLDNRTVDKYGPALLTTAISVGAALAVPQDNERFATAYETMADNLGEVAFQQLEDAIDLEPVMTIPAGTRMVIRPIVDLWFKNPRKIVAAGSNG